MQLLINFFRKRTADAFHLRQLFHTGLSHTRQATETRQQITPAPLPYSTDFFQHGRRARLAALGAMSTDGKAMRLVPYLLDQMQRWTIRW